MNTVFKFAVLLALLLWANFEIHVRSHGRSVAPRQSFDRFPIPLAGWSGEALPRLNEETVKVLKADDYLFRAYERNGVRVAVFVAFYRSQHSGDALHSPKNCLPGAGWIPLNAEVLRAPHPSKSGEFFNVNHYLVQKGEKQVDVLYWYQANQRVFASEYWGKFYLVWDAITKNRTDGALIRLTAAHSSGNAQALHEMVALAQAISGILPEFIQN